MKPALRILITVCILAAVVSLATGRDLTIEERLNAQRAIEDVYWKHRIWPKDNPGPKPPLSETLPESVLRAKVEGSLRKASLLDSYWRQPLTGNQLQAEIDRLTRDTKAPTVLSELFHALGDDPFVIAECLARSLLAEEKAAAAFRWDERIHGPMRRALQAKLDATTDLESFDRLDGDHDEIIYVLDERAALNDVPLDGSPHTVALDPPEWTREMQRLAARFASSAASVESGPDGDGEAYLPLPIPHSALPANARLVYPGSVLLGLSVGRVSTLIEDGERFKALAIRAADTRRVTVATVSWRKRTFEEWAAEKDVAPDPAALVAPAAGYALTAPLTTCTLDTWTPTSTTNAPSARTSHTAVWTGAEMIVWGGYSFSSWSNSGGRYDPATDSWAPTSAGSGTPPPVDNHTAVWTGSQMIVWGGSGPDGRVNVGGRYNPVTDVWLSTSTSTNVPSPRTSHTAVWTGAEMLVYGGFGDNIYFDDGGRYNPGTNSWTTMATEEYRFGEHIAVWTGSLMLVWGGGSQFTHGGRYDPSIDTWTRMALVPETPSARAGHTGVWTGTEMIIWGGRQLSDPYTEFDSGGRYNPVTNTWTMTSTGSNVPYARAGHSAVWSGSDMIVWGGGTFPFDYWSNGGRYVPDTWITSSLTTGSGANVPSGRVGHTAVVTGSPDRRMIVWGGTPSSNTGGVYCSGDCIPGLPCSDGNACTANDMCDQGTCRGTPVPCTPIDGCHDAGVCNPATGACSTPTKPDGVSCSDGNACTASCPGCALDTCVGGVCGCPNLPGPCTGAVSYQTNTFVATDVPKTISSSGTPIVSSTINVTGYSRAIVHKVTLQTTIRHTDSSNLDITLTSPGGRVVTLTTDNGGTNDNVFRGTVWDDDANPGGQVPYTSNNGLATDHAYANFAVATPLAPEEPLGAFVGVNPNGAWTLTISDDAGNDGGSLDGWSLTLATVDPAVVTQSTASYTGTEVPRAIPGTFGAPITSRLIVSGAGASIAKVRATTGITHTNNADLDITLTSPAGTVVTLTTDNGGSTDNIFASVLWDDGANPGGQVPYTSNNGMVTDHNYPNVPATLTPEEALAAFRGENPNGSWVLKISDDVSASNNGSLNSFSLEITTETCPQSCVVDCNDGDTCTGDSCSPAVGCLHSCTGGASCIPGEIAHIGMASDKSTITWDHAGGGSSSRHDLARGLCGQLPVGTGTAEACLASSVSTTTAADSVAPPVGQAFWYDVRGHHPCGVGPYGSQTGGAPRTSGACP